jgi:hypothetical protein
VAAFDIGLPLIYSRWDFQPNLCRALSCERPKTTQQTLFLSFEINNCFPITSELFEKIQETCTPPPPRHRHLPAAAAAKAARRAAKAARRAANQLISDVLNQTRGSGTRNEQNESLPPSEIWERRPTAWLQVAGPSPAPLLSPSSRSSLSTCPTCLNLYLSVVLYLLDNSCFKALSGHGNPRIHSQVPSPGGRLLPLGWPLYPPRKLSERADTGWLLHAVTGACIYNLRVLPTL